MMNASIDEICLERLWKLLSFPSTVCTKSKSIVTGVLSQMLLSVSFDGNCQVNLECCSSVVSFNTAQNKKIHCSVTGVLVKRMVIS